MDCYLSKPIKGEELIEMVERLAEKGNGNRDRGVEGIKDCGLGIRCEEPAAAGSISVSNPKSLIPNPSSSDPQSPVPAFNLDEAVKTCYGEYGLFQEVAGCLFGDADSLLERMHVALGNGAAGELANTAHRLKGTVSYLGAAPALAATRHVEEIGHSGDLTAAPAAIDNLAAELDRLKDALRSSSAAEELIEIVEWLADGDK